MMWIAFGAGKRSNVMSTDEDKIILALKGNAEGIHSSELKNILKNGTVDRTVNNLLKTKAVEMVQVADGFFLRIPKGTNLANSSPEEQLIFSLIEESGSKGIWIKDIRERSGLTEHQMKRVLKNLEKQKMVKAIKAVGTTRKCYMLFNLDADESVSGGIFYSNQEVDAGFVQTLVNVSVAYLEKRHKQAFQENQRKVDALRLSSVSVLDVANFIRERNICKVAMNETDIEHIMELAWKRNRVYKLDEPGYYRFRPTNPGVDGTTFAICNFCPVRTECRVGSKISPETCAYFDTIKGADIVETQIDDLEYDSDF